MPQETKSDQGNLMKQQAESLQGLVASADDEQALLDALEKAFDYRGDVTLTLTDGRTVEGYVFDRRRSESLHQSIVRLLPPDSDDRIFIRFDEIASLAFSGKDNAHGKTFENWVRRYVEKKLKGEEASIHGEPLD